MYHVIKYYNSSPKFHILAKNRSYAKIPKPMKILLINPPREHEIKAPTPEVLEKNRGFNPPLGLLFIAAILEKQNHQVNVIDCQVEEYNYQQIDDLVKAQDYDLLGLTVMTFSLVDSLMISSIAKKHHPQKPIVWGGPHLHIYAKESAQFAEVDYVITGEGELAILDLIANLQNKKSWEQVKGVGTFKDQKYLYNGNAPIIENLDTIPFVARHLTPIHKYNSILAKSSTVTTIFSSRGCPYKCSFCDRPQLRPNFRARSAKNVVDEMELCVKMGIKEFIFYDDTFTVDKKRVHQICDDIIQRNLNISWDCRTSISAMDEKLLQHMAQAGCAGIHYGIEAGTAKIQKVIQKNLNLDRIDLIITQTQQAGIKAMAYFMLGNPKETPYDVKESLKFIKKLNPDFLHITGLLPFPATQIYLQGLKSGMIKEDYWLKFAKNPKKEFITPHWPEYFTRNQLEKLIVKSYQSYYLRPHFLMRRLFQIRSIGEFIRNLKFGWGLLAMKINHRIDSKTKTTCPKLQKI
ncbi:hypothetical protein BVY03_00330 [bacterium K02(2017)]|nr:hypothetical protein BVY03_00330 [bacterium K02(2017)]